VDKASLTRVRDRTPTGLTTPESYLGYARAQRFVGTQVQPGRAGVYRFPPTIPLNDLAFDGTWTVLQERAISGTFARLRVHYQASKVYLVLGGKGRVDVLLNGSSVRSVRVHGDRLYTLFDSPRELDALLELRFTPGISAYAFTFG
jgi:hypothetical protein